MAKKQLKKLNQPKKYLQGGSNMGSVAMMRQNPYYLGQVEQREAESRLDDTRQQAMTMQQNAVQAKKESEAQEKAALDQSISSSTANLGQAILADKKAGNLGKLMLKNPNLTTATSWAPIAASTAPTAASIGQVAPTVVNPIMTNAGGNAATQMVVGQAAPTVSTVGQTVTGTANVAGTANAVTGATAGATGSGGLMAANMSSLGAAGIGVAATVGGQIIKKRANDNSAYTFTDKERRGNTGGSMLSSAGTGFSTGAMLGSIVPGVGNVVGGLIGAGIGAGVGAFKAKKENQAAEEESKRLRREQAEVAGAYQSAAINSRLSGVDTGFGYNSSTNMNNQFTNQYQVARLGGTTGIQEDRRTKKVPGGKIVPIEGTDAVEFIGRSHEKGGVTIDRNTEVEGGETMDQVNMNNNNKQDYIFSKYLKLGGKSFAQRHKEILKGSGSQADIQQLASMQEKVAGRNPQQVAAYGGFHKYLEGGASATDAPTACPDGYVKTDWGACEPAGFKESQQERWKNFGDKYGNDIFKDDTRGGRKFDRAGAEIEKEFFGTKDRWKNISDQEGTKGETIFLTKEDRKKEKRGKLNLTYPAAAEVKPTVDTKTVIATQNGTANAPVITDLASLDAAYLANKITLGEYNAKWKEFENPAASNASTATAATNTGTQPINQEEQDWRNTWIKQGYVFNAAGEREVPAGKKLVVNDDGSEQIVDDTQSTAGTATYTTPAGITPNGNKQSATQTDNTVAPDGTKLPAGYVWDATLNAPVSSALVTASSTSKGGNAPNAPQTVVPKGAQTPTNASNVQGGVGATTTDDKLVGSKTSGFLPTFENAKENPLWTKENYPAWKSEVSSAIGDTDRQQKIVDYLLNYKGDYSAEVQKRIKGKTGQDLLNTIQNLATDNKPGIFHEAVRQALEASKPVPVVPPKVLPKEPEKPKEPEAPLPEKFKECPPGTYRSTDGTCKPLGDVPQGNRMSSTMLAGLGQLVPVGAALMNPYKIAPGIVGAPSVKGSLMPRMNLNQERASAIQQNVAYKNAVLGQNAGPASLVAMQSANAKTDQQMMQIAKQEQDTNRQLAAEEGKMGMQASMFNAESQQKTQMFNKEFNQKERQYRREDLLGALDTGAARIAGIVKDERSFKSQERLANALDETGSYDRFSILEELNKEAKRKNSPYYGTTETERRRMAAAMHKELNPEGYVSKSEYTKLQEEKAKVQKEKEELEKAGKAKFGGARQYVSRLGQLSGVRATKAKI